MNRNRKPAKFLVTVAALTVLVGAAVLGGRAASAQAKPSADVYKMVFSNNFAGNDWRQELEALAAASVKYPPFKGRIDYKLVRTADNTATSQIASLNDIILTRPDAIVIEPSSPTALNQVIARACAQHIVVVTVDANVTAPCAYQVSTNWYNNGLVAGKWLAKTMGGKGEVFLDRGLAGVSLSNDLLRGYKDGIKSYPGIKIVGYFESQFALGPEQSSVANLLTAHPNVGGHRRIRLRFWRNQGTPGRRQETRSGCRLFVQRFDGQLREGEGCQVHSRHQCALSRSAGNEDRPRRARRQEGPEEDHQYPDLLRKQ